MSITAGWYPDPENPAFLRWWDGQTWTEFRYPLTPPQSMPASTQPAYLASAAHTPALASGGAVPPPVAAPSMAPAPSPAAPPAVAPAGEENAAPAHAEATVLEPSVEADVPPSTPPVSNGILSTPVPIQLGNGNLPTSSPQEQEKAAQSSFDTGERLGGLHGSSRSGAQRSTSGGVSSARSSSRTFSSLGEVALAVISVLSLFASAFLIANYLQHDDFLKSYQGNKEMFEKEYETLTEGLPVLEQVLSDLENR